MRLRFFVAAAPQNDKGMALLSQNDKGMALPGRTDSPEGQNDKGMPLNRTFFTASSGMLNPQFVHPEMGPPDRFGKAIAAATGQDDFRRTFLTDQMARRHEKGLDVPFAPQNPADRFTLEQEIGHVPFFRPDRLMFPDQPALGAADRRYAEEKSHVGGQADPPRVGNALAVENGEIRGVR